MTYKNYGRNAGLLVLALVLIFGAGPARAQFHLQMLMGSPFAGRVGAIGRLNMAPYGSQAGALPHMLQSTNGMMINTQNAGTGMQNSMARIRGMDGLGSRRPPDPEPMRMAERNLGGGAGADPGKREAPKLDVKKTTAHVGEAWVELLIGACAGGAFIGAFAAATAISAAPAVAGAAAPAAITAATAAMGVGCGIGVAAAAVSFGAIFGYRALTN
jgi:hypothetical protein